MFIILVNSYFINNVNNGVSGMDCKLNPDNAEAHLEFSQTKLNRVLVNINDDVS